MPIKKSFKCIGLFLIGIASLTIIFYLTVIAFVAFEINKEYVPPFVSGVLHSIIVLLSGHKLRYKIGISLKSHLLFTTFIPALFFDGCCILWRISNVSVSIFDGTIAEIILYIIFMDMASSIASIAVVLFEAVRLLTITLRRGGFRHRM